MRDAIVLRGVGPARWGEGIGRGGGGVVNIGVEG